MMMESMDSVAYSFSTRHLSAQETIADLKQMHGAGIVVNASHLRTTHRLTQRTMESALRQLVDFQPVLRMKILKGHKGTTLLRRFEEMDPLQVDFVLQLAYKRDSWIQMIEAEMGRGFDSSVGPLWRVIYVEMPPKSDDSPSTSSDRSDTSSITTTYSQWLHDSSVTIHPNNHRPSYSHEGILIFKIHQAIADSVSVMNLVNDQLIPIIKSTMTSGALPSLTPSPMMPAVESSFKSPILPSKYKRTINYKNAVANHKPEGPLKEVPPPPVPLLGTPSDHTDKGHPSRVWCYKLPSQLSRSLCEVCNEKRVSLDDVLLFSACFALAHRVDGSNIKMPGDSILCSHTNDLRQFHRQPSQSIGLWEGYDVKRFKVKEFPKVMKVEKFWAAVNKFASEQTAASRPWTSTKIYQDLLKAIQNNSNVRPVAEMFKSHFELTVQHKDQQTNGLLQHQNGHLPSHLMPTNRPQLANPVQVAEQYSFLSVSDLSNAPMSMNFLFYGGRAHCNVTYNVHWLNEDFIKAFVIAHTKLLTQVAFSRTDRRNAEDYFRKGIVVERSKSFQR